MLITVAITLPAWDLVYLNPILRVLDKYRKIYLVPLL